MEEKTEVKSVNYEAVDQLEEADFLKLRLLNRNVDFFTSQAELMQMKLIEASRALMGLSNELTQKYNLSDSRQVDVATGMIKQVGGEFLGGVDGETA